MSDLFPAAELVLRPPARPARGPMTLKIYYQQLTGIARRDPEVMVKITRGGTHSLERIKAHLAYIARHGKSHGDYVTKHGEIYAINERGERLAAKDASKQADLWVFNSNQPQGGKKSLNVVLSMPPGTHPRRFWKAARRFGQKNFAGHNYVMVLHEDRKHLHAHVCINKWRFDAEQPDSAKRWVCLQHRKGNLVQWRIDFAAELNRAGIRANATPRRARGVTRKSGRIHWRERKLEELAKQGKLPPQVEPSRVARERAAAAVGPDPGLKPWEVAARKRRREIERNYRKLTGLMEENPNPSVRRVGSQLRARVESWEPVRSTREVDRSQARAHKQARSQSQSIDR